MSADKLLDSEVWAGWDEAELRTACLARLKGGVFIAMCGLVYVYLADLASGSGHLPEGVHPEASLWRALAQCLLLVAMSVQLFVELFRLPPSKSEDETYVLMQMAGKPIYLTFWILSIQFVHACAAAIAEVALLADKEVPGLSETSYAVALFVGTLGVVLTLLFLKFNWFEENWQKQWRVQWERRGIPYGILALLAHIPSLPVAILDLVVKDVSFLKRCTPSITVNLGAISVFTVAYISWIHIWWRASEFKSWPYPFLHAFDTCLKRIIFTIAIWVAVSIVMLLMSLLP